MLIKKHNVYRTTTLAKAACQRVMRMRPLGNLHTVSRFDGSSELFNKRNRSGDYGS